MAKSGQPAITHSPGAANGWNTIGLLSLVSLIWGAIFPLTNIAVHEGLTPITIATVRLLLGAAVLIGVTAVTQGSFARLTAANLKLLAPIAFLLLAMPHILMTWSQYFISSSQAVILMATVPLLTAFFVSMSRPKTTIAAPGHRGLWDTALRLLPGFLGIVLLVGRSAVHDRGNELPGILAALLASACCARAILMMSRLPRMPALTVSASICTIAAMAMLPVFILTGQSSIPSLSFEAVAATIFLGLVCTGLSSMAHTKLTTSAGPVFASLGFYLSPIAGLTLSALLLGESIGKLYMAAILLVLASVYLVSPAVASK